MNQQIAKPGDLGAGHPQQEQRIHLESAPLWLEISVVGGLGLAGYFGPAIYDIVRGSVIAVWPRVSGCAHSMLVRIQKRLEPLSRRRRSGSLVRVIAYLLPDCIFEPPTRIFVPGMHRHVLSTYGCSDGQSLFIRTPSDNQPVGTGGVIVAFELDAESECTDIVEDIDIVDVSSNPEGWDLHISTFNMPFSNGKAFQCSTPTPVLPDLCYQNTILNDSMSTEATDFEDNLETKDEIAALRRVVEDLTKKMEILNQFNSTCMTIRQSQIVPDDSALEENFPSPPPELLNSPLRTERLPTPPPPPPMLVRANFTSGGPPPPPPPMPLTFFQGSVPIKITKSKTTKEPPKPTKSMMDILKDLDKVKLRSILRSPGGTPVKERNRNNDRNSLEYALKKRFESMHSPAGSDDENLSLLFDKENEFDDSIVQSKNSPSRNLFNRKMNRKSSTLKPRNVGIEKYRNAETPPFGPHLLKKRNQNENVPPTSNA